MKLGFDYVFIFDFLTISIIINPLKLNFINLVVELFLYPNFFLKVHSQPYHSII